MIFDTHAHLNFRAFNNDRNEIIKKCLDRNIWIVNVGSNLLTSKVAVDLSNQYDHMYASVGLHPIHLNPDLRIDDENEEPNDEIGFDYDKYKQIALNKKVIAIGETGLDYYYRPKTKTKLEIFKQRQKEVLIKHIQLAEELNLPIIFHCRMAHNEMIEILKVKDIKGVIHCFTGNLEQARQYMDLGYHLGFNGIIFKLNLDEVIKQTPIDKILLETDCPYLIPLGYVTDRNDPIGVEYVAKRVAEIKSMDLEELKEKTNQNAKSLFNIDINN